MTNKLGEIRRKNVKAFIAKKKMSVTEFATIALVAAATAQLCFGNGKKVTSPSTKTMKKIYAAVEEIPAGSLDKVDYSPIDKPVVASVLAKKPVVIPEDIYVQVGRLKTPVTEAMAKRILIMIALDDDD